MYLSALSSPARRMWCNSPLLFLLTLGCSLTSSWAAEKAYDARIEGRQVLSPPPEDEPCITGADIFGVRPGKPIRYRVSATGNKPIEFSATGLPAGMKLDSASGWISGRAPLKVGDFTVDINASNARGNATRKLILRVGDTICLTPPMGWNSWYVHSEGVSEDSIREVAEAMDDLGLTDHGWTYLNIDDCWTGLRNPETKAIEPNAKFGDMKALVDFVNSKGLKLGLYSTPWMSTYAGYIGGSAPNKDCDYSEFFLPEDERVNPHQVFGRSPSGIHRGLCRVGPEWLVDRDAVRLAEWGIDYVKYDWKEWTLVNGGNEFRPSKNSQSQKTEESGITRRLHENFRELDRDIVLSLSPAHNSYEASFVPKYCNLWRLTGDIEPKWERIIAPFELEDRLRLTKAGHFCDLDMLQIGPLGTPNRAEVVFKPSPLTPAEQYTHVTLWCILTQPLLLSCHVPTMDDFDLNLVSNDEVLSINQDRLCKQGARVASDRGKWEIWAKDLADGSKAVAMFNLTGRDQVLSISHHHLGISGQVRDIWRQENLGPIHDQFTAIVSPHGVAFMKVTP